MGFGGEEGGGSWRSLIGPGRGICNHLEVRKRVLANHGDTDTRSQYILQDPRLTTKQKKTLT